VSLSCYPAQSRYCSTTCSWFLRSLSPTHHKPFLNCPSLWLAYRDHLRNCQYRGYHKPCRIGFFRVTPEDHPVFFFVTLRCLRAPQSIRFSCRMTRVVCSPPLDSEGSPWSLQVSSPGYYWSYFGVESTRQLQSVTPRSLLLLYRSRPLHPSGYSCVSIWFWTCSCSLIHLSP